ncbi:hypothetical protein M407DRAFT_32233 [Tulasnella calospora MUT 4182]|uniref:Uncharacterized protein n=1 Tax=Tulasnella calospora MUT 4182 TaxID=1051891 RepID=A0A0C3L9B0_9AGAM|nr:hypothetical protein M407DRAFT_32233 [Tulasnella calospora MUT 4182]
MATFGATTVVQTLSHPIRASTPPYHMPNDSRNTLSANFWQHTRTLKVFPTQAGHWPSILQARIVKETPERQLLRHNRMFKAFATQSGH